MVETGLEITPKDRGPKSDNHYYEEELNRGPVLLYVPEDRRPRSGKHYYEEGMVETGL